MPTPTLSVLMSVYNTEKYLADAVESILNQGFTDYEFIIINDGSTDRSEEILLSYAQRDSRIKLVSRENRGLVASLNEALGYASASLVARMDADDIALPERFSEQVKFLDNNDDVMCVGTAQIIIDDDGDELTALNVPTESMQIDKLLLQGHCPIEHPSVMFRASVVKDIGGYREQFAMAEDYDLWLRISEYGKLANINKPLLKYRYLNSSVSGSNQTQQLDATRRACEEAWKRRGVKGDFTAVSEWRASDNKKSQHKFTLKFGWWAFNYKNKPAAIKYAKKAIKIMPFNMDGWKLLILSYLKLKETYV